MVRHKRIRSVLVRLPHELCNEILTRLPIKSLVRFRCVSKLWCSTIDNPSFSLAHMKYLQNANNVQLLVIEPSDLGDSKQFCTFRSVEKFRKISKFEINVTWYERYEPVGYINGILCMKRYVSQTIFFKILLWNPSIRKALDLPLPRILYMGETNDVDCFFGYDQSENDYKVVATPYVGGLQIHRFVEIFTLSTYSWKFLNIERGPCHWMLGKPKVFLNGLIYWSGIDIFNTTPKGRFSHFVSFNVANESFNYIDLPDLEHHNNHERIPIVFDQSIALLENYETFAQIWVLEDIKSLVPSWTKQYKINLHLLYKCLYIKEDGELIFSRKKGGVSSYNIKTQETKVIAKSYRLTPLFTSVYVESLAFIKGVGPGTTYTFPVLK